MVTWDVVQKDRRVVEDMGQGLCRNAVQLLVAKDGMINDKIWESVTHPLYAEVRKCRFKHDL